MRMRESVRLAAVVTVLVFGKPIMAHAALAVIDSAAVAKLAEQVSSLQKQFSELQKHTQWLTEMSGTLQEQLNAIGALGQINIPSLNLGNVANKIRRDLQCLKPDFAKLFPSISQDEMEFGSICDGRDVYGKALWLDPEKVFAEEKLEAATPEERWRHMNDATAVVSERRQALVKEVSAGGLAAADLAATDAAEAAEKAASDLEAQAKAAQTQQDRLAVIAQGIVLSNKQQVQQNQLLAQLLKVQSSMLMMMSTPANDRLKKEAEAGQ